jgi:hypothetical protein
MVDIKKKVKDVVWHHKGDYFSTVSPAQSATSVLVHTHTLLLLVLLPNFMVTL